MVLVTMPKLKIVELLIYNCKDIKQKDLAVEANG